MKLDGVYCLEVDMFPLHPIRHNMKNLNERATWILNWKLRLWTCHNITTHIMSTIENIHVWPLQILPLLPWGFGWWSLDCSHKNLWWWKFANILICDPCLIHYEGAKQKVSRNKRNLVLFESQVLNKFKQNKFVWKSSPKKATLNTRTVSSATNSPAISHPLPSED